MEPEEFLKHCLVKFRTGEGQAFGTGRWITQAFNSKPFELHNAWLIGPPTASRGVRLMMADVVCQTAASVAYRFNIVLAVPPETLVIYIETTGREVAKLAARGCPFHSSPPGFAAATQRRALGAPVDRTAPPAESLGGRAATVSLPNGVGELTGFLEGSGDRPTALPTPEMDVLTDFAAPSRFQLLIRRSSRQGVEAAAQAAAPQPLADPTVPDPPVPDQAEILAAYDANLTKASADAANAASELKPAVELAERTAERVQEANTAMEAQAHEHRVLTACVASATRRVREAGYAVRLARAQLTEYLPTLPFDLNDDAVFEALDAAFKTACRSLTDAHIILSDCKEDMTKFGVPYDLALLGQRLLAEGKRDADIELLAAREHVAATAQRLQVLHAAPPLAPALGYGRSRLQAAADAQPELAPLAQPVVGVLVQTARSSESVKLNPRKRSMPPCLWE